VTKELIDSLANSVEMRDLEGVGQRPFLKGTGLTIGLILSELSSGFDVYHISEISGVDVNLIKIFLAELATYLHFEGIQ
jgi:hypothetical protein